MARRVGPQHVPEFFMVSCSLRWLGNGCYCVCTDMEMTSIVTVLYRSRDSYHKSVPTPIAPLDLSSVRTLYRNETHKSALLPKPTVFVDTYAAHFIHGRYRGRLYDQRVTLCDGPVGRRRRRPYVFASVHVPHV
ncbi:unnamed protein product [Soboliphyme baturini]|uniref:Secreted protein n=1 Tax=Soboliphyme baturini TaxID=241478 RepID=A0A183IC44_9BILA|nr:unnamed protein product [Soboliphyme baturini]